MIWKHFAPQKSSRFFFYILHNHTISNLSLSENGPPSRHRTDPIRHPRANQLRLQQLMVVLQTGRATSCQSGSRGSHGTGHGWWAAGNSRDTPRWRWCGIIIVVKVICNGVQEAVGIVRSRQPETRKRGDAKWLEIHSHFEYSTAK